MAGFERHEVDARPVKAEPKAVHRDQEGSRHDQPAVIERRRALGADDEAIFHASAT